MSGVVLPGYDDSLPVTIDVAERKVSPHEAVRLIALKIGNERGYAATRLEPAAAMGVCAAIVDRCKALGVDVVDDLLAWCLAIHLAPDGVSIEDAARRVEGRLIDATVKAARGD